ncbi:MAG: lamin tail domain-containing protein [Planctomycetota bacterium]
MNRSLLPLVLLAAALAGPALEAGERTAHPAALLSPAAHLEIHQINVQEGACVLLIGPDGTTILIDAGGPGKGVDEVVPYLASIGILPSQGLDYMLASHRDEDHLGGLDEVILAGYDVHLAIWDNGSDKITEQVLQFLDAAALTSAGFVAPAPLGASIDLGAGATATFVVVGGEVLGYGVVPGAEDEENDLSVGVLVQYGGFDYLTAGDLGGGEWSVDHDCTGRDTTQKNLESPLAYALLPGGGADLLTSAGLEVLVVNHQGSESSTNFELVNLLTPSVAVIPVGAGQGTSYNHPRRDVVEGVLLAGGPCITARPAVVLQTEEGEPVGPETSFAGYCVGDVIISTSGVSSFRVAATGEVSQGPDERLAARVPSRGALFALDGSGTLPARLVINEIMQNPADVPDADGEWFELYNPGSAGVDINGWTIRDDDFDFHLVQNGGPLMVPAGGYLVLGRSGDPDTNGHYHPDYVYSGFVLGNDDDEIILVDALGNLVDTVEYTGLSPWPDPTGKSMELRHPDLDNGDGANWGQATERGGTYEPGGSDLGTPGARNSIAP